MNEFRFQDYDFIKGRSVYEDVLQCNNQASSSTPRGHQYPAAFLITASGLSKVSYFLRIDNSWPFSPSSTD